MVKAPNSLVPFADTEYSPTTTPAVVEDEDGRKVREIPPSFTLLVRPPNFMENPPEYTPLMGGGWPPQLPLPLLLLAALGKLLPGSRVYSKGEVSFRGGLARPAGVGAGGGLKSAALMAHCPLKRTTPSLGPVVSLPRMQGISASAAETVVVVVVDNEADDDDNADVKDGDSGGKRVTAAA
jgi:hypothetical protein